MTAFSVFSNRAKGIRKKLKLVGFSYWFLKKMNEQDGSIEVVPSDKKNSNSFLKLDRTSPLELVLTLLLLFLLFLSHKLKN